MPKGKTVQLAFKPDEITFLNWYFSDEEKDYRIERFPLTWRSLTEQQKEGRFSVTAKEGQEMYTEVENLRGVTVNYLYDDKHGFGILSSGRISKEGFEHSSEGIIHTLHSFYCKCGKCGLCKMKTPKKKNKM